jgi:hypothetical protein
MPQPTGVDPSQCIAGDPNDPAYGSFTKPFDVEQFYNYADPGYAFELQQGTQTLQNAASAGSGAFSGAALKDLLGYSQNFARTGYNDAFNRYQVQQGNIYNRLSRHRDHWPERRRGRRRAGTAARRQRRPVHLERGISRGRRLRGRGQCREQRPH